MKNADRKIRGILFLVFSLMFWLLTGCSQEGSSDSDAIAAVTTSEARLVKAVTLVDTAAAETRTFPGVVEAACETDLAFRVSGPLVRLDVKIGEKVEKGALIAQIDPRDFEVNIKRLTASIAEARASLKAMKTGARPEDLASLKADLAAARSQREEAKSNFERYQNLYREKAAARAVYDTAKTAYETVSARVTAAENALAKGQRGARAEDISAMTARIKGMNAQLDAAENALADTALRAPFDGYIHEKFAENYETVQAGQRIVSFLDMKTAEVHTRIPQSLLMKQAEWEEIGVCFEFQPGTCFPAAVKEIGKKTQGAAQSFPMVLTVQTSPDLKVRPGAAADIQFRLKKEDRRTDGFDVPVAALFALPGGMTGIWKVMPETMTLQSVSVNTGDVGEGSVRIFGDVRPGDTVVSAGARFLREGQKVRLMTTGEGGDV